MFDGHRGIEVGNIFYLGTKYSAPMKATFLDAAGQERPIEMGCYGIGITRTAAAAVEQNHDDNGIIWPLPMAPAHVHLVPVNCDRRSACATTAEDLYAKLQAAGVEVLLDDRDERPGIKFKDADLIGIPLRVTIGAKSLERNCVEFKRRTDKAAEEIPLADVVERIAALVRDGAVDMSLRWPFGIRQGGMRSRLIFALDVSSITEAIELGRTPDAPRSACSRSASSSSCTPARRSCTCIRERGGEVFLDLKFHDIPRTVAKAAVEATRMGVRMFDVHASGSLEMMQRTVGEVSKVCRGEGLRRPKVLAVTVLTSLNRDDLKRVGVASGVENQVVRLARLAKEAKMDGVVASPQEIAPDPQRLRARLSHRHARRALARRHVGGPEAGDDAGGGDPRRRRLSGRRPADSRRRRSGRGGARNRRRHGTRPQLA